MTNLSVEGPELGRIHKANNDKKFFCHFTGFLEGIACSGYLEPGEIEPLLAECVEFITRVSDGDAHDIIEDFKADLMSHQLIKDLASWRAEEIDQSCEKSSLNRFLGFCRGIVCDGLITEREANAMIRWLSDSPSLINTVGVSQIQTVCIDALEDGIISSHESEEICEAIGQVVGDCYGDTGLSQMSGVANFDEHRLTDLTSELEGANIVLTGKFKRSPRREFEDELCALGALIGRSVSGRTDYLIIGGEASRDWIEMNRGTKIRKAQDLRLSNNRPLFISESQLLRLMREAT